MTTENIISISPKELYNNIGSHKFEIVDISTEWCGPCQYMKEKVFPKIVKKFNDKDLVIYLIDGDELGDIQTDKLVIGELEEFIIENNPTKKELELKLLDSPLLPAQFTKERK